MSSKRRRAVSPLLLVLFCLQLGLAACGADLSATPAPAPLAADPTPTPATAPLTVDSTPTSPAAPPATVRALPRTVTPRDWSRSRIALENEKPGTDAWAEVGRRRITHMAAFAGATSVNAGDPITLYISSTGTLLTASLYRLGYYQNHGGRLITTFRDIAATPQPNCTRVTATGLVTCPWQPTYTLQTDPAWISGMYLLHIDSDANYRFTVTFVVRNDDYPAAIVAQHAAMTEQAYSSYGGESFYGSFNRDGRKRAYQVSFDRPYDSGRGTGRFFAWEVDMVRWLEAGGYDVSYVSDVDVATNPKILLNHRVFLNMGHDEYWTWAKRDNVEAALAAGINMIFAGANESFWNVRLEDSPIGPNRIITCYKDATLDPIHTAPDVTFRFDSPILKRPESALIGLGYGSYYTSFGANQFNAPWVISAPADRWYFDCTTLQPGEQVNNLVGHEWDTVSKTASPPGLEVIATSPVNEQSGKQTVAHSAIYTATSGANVFAAGSIHWAWGLIDHSYANATLEPNYLSNDADPRVAQFMANILDYFLGAWDGQPRACGPANQHFYAVEARPTRTPMPQVPAATPTPGS